jgi:hypothetical protein
MKVNHPFQIGKSYFIRTVTMIYEKELVISSASWIADTGRFAQAVATGNFDEVEPYPDNVKVTIGRDAILDAMPVNWALPRVQK